MTETEWLPWKKWWMDIAKSVNASYGPPFGTDSVVELKMRGRYVRSTARAVFVLVSVASALLWSPFDALGESWRIGVVCPLTTESKSFGIGHLQGVTLAEDQFQSDSPIKLDLEIVDDRSEPNLAEAAVRRLFEEGAVAILGPCNSSVTRRVIALNLELPIISSLSTAAELTASPKDHPFFFRANVSDTQRMDQFLTVLFGDVDRRPRRLIVLYEGNGDPYGEGMLRDTRKWLRDNQPNFTNSPTFVTRPYPRNISDTEAEQGVQELKDLGLGGGGDGILILGLTTDAQRLVVAIRHAQLSAALYIPGPESDVFKSLAFDGIPIAGIRFVSVWDNRDDTAMVQKFRSRFRAQFGAEEPTYAAALAYDATRLVLKALTAALEGGGSRDIPEVRRRLRDRLKDIGPDENIVISGDQRFKNEDGEFRGEFRSVRFKALQFDHKGNSAPWDQELPPYPNPYPYQSIVPAFLPNALVLILVGFAGMLGSATRECYHATPRDAVTMLKMAARPLTLVVDPVIAVAVFVTGFLGILVWQPAIIAAVPQQAQIIYWLAVVGGFLAGFLGIRALYAVLGRLGISEDMIQPPTRKRVSARVKARTSPNAAAEKRGAP